MHFLVGSLVVFFTAGILYFSVWGGTSSVVLWVTIACGVVLLGLLVRFIRSHKEANMGFFGRLTREESDTRRAELEDEIREIQDRLIEKPYVYTPGMYNKRSEVMFTRKVTCRKKGDEVHDAILLIRKDETITVKCEGQCWDCSWEDA